MLSCCWGSGNIDLLKTKVPPFFIAELSSATVRWCLLKFAETVPGRFAELWHSVKCSFSRACWLLSECLAFSTSLGSKCVCEMIILAWSDWSLLFEFKFAPNVVFECYYPSSLSSSVSACMCAVYMASFCIFVFMCQWLLCVFTLALECLVEVWLVRVCAHQMDLCVYIVAACDFLVQIPGLDCVGLNSDWIVSTIKQLSWRLLETIFGGQVCKNWQSTSFGWCILISYSIFSFYIQLSMFMLSIFIKDNSYTCQML